MSVRCSGCGALTVWDGEVGSSVCMSCGTLVDSSQCVLTSDHPSNYNEPTEVAIWNTRAALKSIRTGNNWDLKGAKDRRNVVSLVSGSILLEIKYFSFQIAAVDLVNSLATSFNVPGLSPRAIALFNQARTVTGFHWGRKSTSVVAACFIIALRESNRLVIVRDIASVLDIPPNSIIREYQRVTAVLGLSLTLLDPSVYIPPLQGYLLTVLKDPGSQSDLSASLRATLGRINLNSTTDTAISISHLLARLNPEHDVLRLPAPPTACAIFILALEAELRATLNPLGELAKCLGVQYQVTKGVAMARYKTLQNEVASWVEKVPWLDKYEKRGGRAIVSKRHVVARGLKDVIKFQDDVWQQRTKLSPDWEVTDEESNAEKKGTALLSLRAGKEGSKSSRTTIQALHFLLDPLGTSLLPSSSLSSSSPRSQLSTATYILTTPHAIISSRTPSRLQLLAAQRGGADEDKISDEELFTEGELEGLLRTEDEICVLRESLGWLEEDVAGLAESDMPEGRLHCKGKKRRTDDSAESEDRILNGSALRLRKKVRLDMNAYAQFMAEGHGKVGEINEAETHLQLLGLEAAMHESNQDSEYSDEEAFLSSTTRDGGSSIVPFILDQDAELVVNEWRPPSPESEVHCRYQEEYD